MDVTGLLLWRISGGRDATEKLAKSYFTEFIDAAQRGGMEAVCETPHFAESIRSRPSNRDRLLGMKVDEFVEILQTWRDEFLQSVDFPVVGASEADLQSIGIPSCLISGNDIVHTPSAARAAHAALQKSELHSDVVEVRDESALLPEWNRKQWADAEPNVVRIFIEFLRKLQ